MKSFDLIFTRRFLFSWHALSWFCSWVFVLLCVKLKIEFPNINNKKDFVGRHNFVLSLIFSHTLSLPSSVEFWKSKNNRWKPQLCYFNTNLHPLLPIPTHTWQISIFVQSCEETTRKLRSYLQNQLLIAKSFHIAQKKLNIL